MRVESMSSRLDFDERRARALEGVVQYRPGAVPPLQPPAGAGGRAPAPADGSRAGRAPDAPATPARPAAGGAGRRAAGADARSPGGARRTGSAGAASDRSGLARAPGQRPNRVEARATATAAMPHAERTARPDRSRRRRRPIAANREARGRRPALRRGHQRRRRAARALHRRAAGAARRGRGPHDLRARLRHLAQRAARPASSTVNGVTVRRFPVRRERDPRRLRPAVAARLRAAALDRRRARVARQRRADQPGADRHYRRAARPTFDFFVFFSYRYYHAWHGARRVPAKAVLVPTAERDPAIGLVDLRAGVPRRARASCTTRPKSAR